MQLQQVTALGPAVGPSHSGAKSFVLPGKQPEAKRVTVMKAQKLKSSMIKFSPSPSPSPPLHSEKSANLVKQKFVISKRISPGSMGSGSSVEDESAIGVAKIGGVHQNHMPHGASQSYLTNRAPAHQGA